SRCGQVGEDGQLGHPSRTKAAGVDGVGAGDVSSDLEGIDAGPDVAADVPVSVFRSGVAPRDEEHLNAAAHRVLHETAPGRQVEKVEPVDLGGDHDRRSHGYPAGRRLILNQFEERAAMDDLAPADSDGLTNPERTRVHLGGHTPVVTDVVEEMSAPV